MAISESWLETGWELAAWLIVYELSYPPYLAGTIRAPLTVELEPNERTQWIANYDKMMGRT